MFSQLLFDKIRLITSLFLPTENSLSNCLEFPLDHHLKQFHSRRNVFLTLPIPDPVPFFPWQILFGNFLIFVFFTIFVIWKNWKTTLSFCLFQLSPGRDGSDTDMEPTASQSADCEPTPPLQRHGSKNNFFLPPVENNDSPRHPQIAHHRHPILYPRDSPHPRPRYRLKENFKQTKEINKL